MNTVAGQRGSRETASSDNRGAFNGLMSWISRLNDALCPNTDSKLMRRATAHALRFCAACYALITVSISVIFSPDTNKIFATEWVHIGLSAAFLMLALTIRKQHYVYFTAFVFLLSCIIHLIYVAMNDAGLGNPLIIGFLLPAFWAWLMLGIRGSLPIGFSIFMAYGFLTLWTFEGNVDTSVQSYFDIDTPVITGLTLIGFMVIGISSAVITWLSTSRHDADIVREREEAQRSNREKSEFIASIAHEVRTPLTGLMGMLELLAKEELTHQQHEMADTARTSARSTLQLINDLLDLSKIEVGELKLLPEPVEIVGLFKSTMREFQRQIEEKSLEYSIEYPDSQIWILADPTRLRQVLINYLSNAIKFTETGYIKSVLVCEEMETGEYKVQMSISDTGPGVPKNRRKQIFARFVQVDAEQRATHGGTGLGLAIVADLARLQGGHVWVENNVDGGSVFYFDAIFKRTSALELPNPSDKARLSSDVTILIADDSAGNQRVLSRVLQGLGYKTISAENGSDALVVLVDTTVDLILMDYNMPVKDGPTALREIRALPDERCNIPVIGLSADNSDKDMRRWIEASADGFIQKPIDFASLDLTIRRVLGVQRQSKVDEKVDQPDDISKSQIAG